MLFAVIYKAVPIFMPNKKAVALSATAFLMPATGIEPVREVSPAGF